LRYFGGKFRLAKQISSFLNKQILYYNYDTYLEPFVGGANIPQYIQCKNKFAYDINHYLISLYQSLQSGYNLPDIITEEQYKDIKNNKDKYDPELVAFVGYGCSYSGKFFGGYARDKRGDDYCKNAKNSILRKMNKMQDVIFQQADYRNLHPTNSIIYCDPPYQNTTQNGYINSSFNSEEFWDIIRSWSKTNKVYISEYNAPSDFISVLQFDTKTNIRTKIKSDQNRIEKIFTIIKNT